MMIGIAISICAPQPTGAPAPPATPSHILDDLNSGGGGANQVVKDDLGSGGTVNNEIKTDP